MQNSFKVLTILSNHFSITVYCVCVSVSLRLCEAIGLISCLYTDSSLKLLSSVWISKCFFEIRIC